MRVRIMAESNALQSEYRAGGLDQVATVIRQRIRGAGALDYRVQRPDGVRLAGNLPLIDRIGWVDLTLGSEEAKGRSQQSGEQPEWIRIFAVRLSDGAMLAVGDDLSQAKDAQDAILGAFGWAIGLMIFLGTIAGSLLSRTFLRRVDVIASTAQAIIDGDLRQRIPVQDTGDDFDQLAITLNHMLDRIAALMESIRQVSSAVAHDLRTPLARLYQQLDTARMHATSASEYQQAIGDAMMETEQILDTFSALLRISHVEAGSRRASFRVVDLSGIVKSVGDAFMPAIEEEQHHLVLEITPEIKICGDKDLLTQLLANLVENALRHTPSGCTIRLSLTQSESRAKLTVEDNGPGVPEIERKRIFERFYRTEPSRTTPGSGLGLSMVAAVTELHGADLSVDDADPGLRVTVTFPLGGRAGASSAIVAFKKISHLPG